ERRDDCRRQRHERIERFPTTGLRGRCGIPAEKACGESGVQVEDTVADGDSAAPCLAVSAFGTETLKYAERQILKREVAIRAVRRFEPAAPRRIVRLIELRHGFLRRAPAHQRRR